MDFQARPDRMHRSWRVAVAVLCALLVVFAGVVQVAHTHADQMATHADCSLCVAAHITVHLTPSPAPAPVSPVVTAVEVEPTCARATALSTFALFTRPPPAASPAAA